MRSAMLSMLLFAAPCLSAAAGELIEDTGEQRPARLVSQDGRHYLMFDAGRGWLAQDLRRQSERLQFALRVPGRTLACDLHREAAEASDAEALWRGRCEAAEGGGLSLAVPWRELAPAPGRGRARDFGLTPGILQPGPLNAITDVAGVRVGQRTVVEGEAVRTGVTAIVPAPGDLYAAPVPAAVIAANGYGKLTGFTQVRELGELETPVLLTCTLCVWTAAQALAGAVWTRGSTINPVVGETNDGWLNDQWSWPLEPQHVLDALAAARDGPVDEGSVGAGTGTQAFGFKGGIGTSSRLLPDALGGHTVGVLVQTNFGGVLRVDGAPVAELLDATPWRTPLRDQRRRRQATPDEDDGSLMIVVATDAALDSHALERLARRAMLGAARTGSFMSNGSGDYVIAFSAHPDLRRDRTAPDALSMPTLMPGALSPLFAAVVEATEEAIYNALFMAEPVSGRGRVLRPVPLAPLLEMLRSRAALQAPATP